MSQRISFIIAMLGGWLLQPNVLAQPQVVLTLKGVGIGSEVSMLGYGTDVQVAGYRAYLTWSREDDTNHPGGVEIFCVTNSSMPVRVGGLESRAQVNGIHVSRQYAYLATGTGRTLTNDPGALEIFDVNIPAAPVRVGRIETPGRASSVTIAGNYAYVTERVRWTGTNLLGALEIFDVSTPTNPIRVATYNTGGSATSIAVSGSHAFLADGITDLQVLDVSNPASPSRIGGFDCDESTNSAAEINGPATYIRVAGNIVYSTGENSGHVLDVTDPANPVRLTSINLLPLQNGFDLSDRFACFPLYVSSWNQFSLAVWDTTNPADPIGIGFDAIWSAPRAIEIVGRHVYLGTMPMWIYEITDVPKIKSVSRIGGNLVVTWDSTPGFRLQRTTCLFDPQWSDVSNSEGYGRVELPITDTNEFFRLVRP